MELVVDATSASGTAARATTRQEALETPAIENRALAAAPEGAGHGHTHALGHSSAHPGIWPRRTRPDPNGMELTMQNLANAPLPAVPADHDEVWAQLAVIARRADRLRSQIADAAAADGTTWSPVMAALTTTCRELRSALAAVPVSTSAEQSRRVVVIGDLRVCRDSRDAWLAGRRLNLPPKVFGVLEQLAADPFRVHPKQELLRSVWDWQGTITRTRSLDTQASRLRRALRDADPGGRAWVVNRWGVGYALLAADQGAAPAVAA